MVNATGRLRDEHHEVRADLAAVRVLADTIDDLTAADVTRRLATVLDDFDRRLLPRLLAADGVLYPVITAALGSDEATATMRRDQLEIVRLVEQVRHLLGRFGELRSMRLRRDIRRLLYSVEAIAGLHLDKEEEIFLPILEDALTADAADVLRRDLQAAERRVLRRAS